MPLTISQRCLHCHEMKPRAEFPVKRELQGILAPKQTVTRFVICKSCLAAHPELWEDWQRDDEPPHKELER